MHTYTVFMPTIPSDVCNVFALRQAARYVSQLYERHLSAVGMTSSQFTLFNVLMQAPGVTMAKLAEMIVMDRTSLVRAVKPLMRDGYLVDKPVAPGSRQKGLWLTAAGRDRFEAAYPLWETAQREYEAMVGAERAAHLRNELIGITRP